MMKFLDQITRLVRKLTKLLIAIKWLSKIIVEIVNMASNYFIQEFLFCQNSDGYINLN